MNKFKDWIGKFKKKLNENTEKEKKAEELNESMDGKAKKRRQLWSRIAVGVMAVVCGAGGVAGISFAGASNLSKESTMTMSQYFPGENGWHFFAGNGSSQAYGIHSTSGSVNISASRNSDGSIHFGGNIHYSYTPYGHNYGNSLTIYKSDGSAPEEFSAIADIIVDNKKVYTGTLANRGTVNYFNNGNAMIVQYNNISWKENTTNYNAFTETYYCYFGAGASAVTTSTSGWNSGGIFKTNYLDFYVKCFPITVSVPAFTGGYVTLQGNGGTYSDGSASKKLTSAYLVNGSSNWWSIADYSKKFSRTGYTLNGWYSAASGGTKVYNADGTCVNGTGYWSNYVYQKTGNLTVYAQWTPNYRTLDVNGYLDGASSGSLIKDGITYGTFDVWINGTRVANDVTDYYNTQITYGSTWKINDIKPTAGRTYSGASEYSGTLTTYTAKVLTFTTNTYTVSYNSNGGTGSMNSQSIKYGTAFKTNKTGFSRTGYRFAGYKDSKGAWWNAVGFKNGKEDASSKGSAGIYEGNGSNWTYTYAENVTLYAQWVANEYAIVYNANGGKDSSGNTGNLTPTQVAIYDQNVALKTDFNLTRDGFKWIGWSDTSDGSGQLWRTDDGKNFVAKNLKSGHTESIVLYAQWKSVYAVDSCENSAGMEAQEFEYTDKDYDSDRYNELTKNLNSATENLPADGFSRSGYKFKGWKIKSIDGKTSTDDTVYADKAEFINKSETNDGNVVLVAQWEQSSVTITYDIGNSVLKSDEGKNEIKNNVQTVAYGKETYLSNGVLASGDMWKTNNSSDTLGGSRITGWVATVYENGQAKEYHYNLGEKISGCMNMTLTPEIFQSILPNLLDSYSIKYDANIPKRATGKQTGTLPSQKNSIKKDENIVMPQAGISLVGWHTDGYWYYTSDGNADNGRLAFGSTQKNVAKYEEITTLYLNWQPNTYTIVYNSNKPSSASHNVSGSVIGTDSTNKTYTNMSVYQYDTSGVLAKNKFTLTGWTFMEWNTKADGSGKLYSDVATVNNLTTTNNDTINLYAQWKPITYYVRYNSNGGNGSTTRQELTYDKSQTLDNCTFTKTGYHFDSAKTWNTAANMSGTYYNNKETKVFNFKDTQGAIQDLYVNWIENTYTIQYHANNGEGEETYISNSILYTSTVTIESCMFSKTGHEFSYWSKNKDGSGDRLDTGYSYNKLTAENNGVIHLYANWKAQKYNLIINPYHNTCYKGSSTPTYKGSANNVIISKGLEYGTTSNNKIGQAQNKGYLLTDYKLNGNDSVSVYDSEGNATTQGGYWTDKNSEKVYTGTEDLTVNAHWAPVHYTIKYNANSGEGRIADLQCEYDKSYKLSDGTGYSKTGYHIIGWSTDKDVSYKDFQTGEDNYDLNETVKNIATKDGATYTLYAVWEPNTYYVEFLANGDDTTGTMSKQKMTYDEIETLSQNTFKRSKYLFNGWNTQPDGTGDKINAQEDDVNKNYADQEKVSNLTTTKDGTVKLYAQWVSTIYTVTYDPNGGEEDPDNPMPNSDLDYDENKACDTTSKLRPITYTENTVIKSYFTKEGYKFIGWNTSKSKANDMVVEYKDGATVCNLVDPRQNKTITLYAVWQPIQYTLHFDKNIPSNPNEDIDPTLEKNLTGTMTDQTMTYDKFETLNKNQYTFESQQYTFRGWSTKADGSGKFFSDQATAVFNLTSEDNAVVTLYAQWSYNGYRIKFNANGANGTMKDEIFYYGVSKALNPNSFTKIGYSFVEWNTEEKGTGDAYADKQSITEIKYSSEENASEGVQTLYAQWDPITYTIHFDKNNDKAKGEMEDTKFTYDEPKELPKNTYTVPGATFVGWSETKDGEGKIYTDGEEIVNLTDKDKSTITFYAQWDYVPVLEGDDLYLVADKRDESKGTTVSDETLIKGKDTYKYDNSDETFKDKLKKIDNPMTATDQEEGDISSRIKVEKIVDKDGNKVSSIDATKTGEYTVTYSATDSFGNKGTGTRKVYVLETPVPEINAGDRYFYVNSNITKTLLMSRVSATDQYEGLITSKVTIDGYSKFKNDSETFSKIGKYTITYKVTNEWGGKATKTVNIYIIDTLDGADRTGDLQYIRKSCSADNDYCLEYLPEDSQWQNKKDELKDSLSDDDSDSNRQIIGNK